MSEPTAEGTVRVRYFAAARQAADAQEESVAGGLSLVEILADLSDRHGPNLEAVLARSTYLVNGRRQPDRAQVVPAGATVDVLPPFAGG